MKTSIITGGKFDIEKYKDASALTFPAPRDEQPKVIMVGNRARIAGRSKTSSWHSFSNLYFDSAHLDKKYEPKLINCVAEMFEISSDLSMKELIMFITKFIRLPPEKVFYAIAKQIGLYQPITMGIRSVFMLWKDHLQELLLKFIQYRNHYIRQKKIDAPLNNIGELIASWKEFDHKHSIDSSSLVLLYSFLPEFPHSIPAIKHKFQPDVRWKKKPIEVKWLTNTKLDTKIGDFLKAVKERKFQYLGFCPREPTVRLARLMSFPTDKLNDCLIAIGYKSRNYVTLHKNIKEVIDSKVKRKLVKIPPITVSKPSQKESYQICSELVKEYLRIYEEMVDSLSNFEYNNIAVARKLIKIAKLLDEFNNSRTKK